MTNDKIIRILDMEYDMEMKCAKMCNDLMKKTFNPIKLVGLYFYRKRYLEHCFGINLAKRQLMKVMEIERES